MCGIVGCVGDVHATTVDRMTDALFHRGPDSAGRVDAGRIQLGARRLRIIDLLDGDQPIFNEAGDKCVIANCEIYNFLELRTRLQSRGHVFKTRSDTEVILHAYEEYGVGALDHLEGMFAFAVKDGNRLLIARDRLGIKPLYYFQVPGTLFAFASEIKALLQHPSLDVSLNMQSLANRMVLGYGFGDETMFTEIKTLRPGHWLEITDGPAGLELREGEYYRPTLDADESLSYSEAQDQLRQKLERAVARHMVSDVPLCLTLSGGLDSTLLAYIMRNQTSGVLQTFTVGDAASGDLVVARSIASQIESSHRECFLDFDEYLDLVVPCTLAEEQPSSLYALPLLKLCREMKSEATVCLNGEGADELFGGYDEYRNRYRKLEAMKRGLACARRIGLEPSLEATQWIEDIATATSWEQYVQMIFILNLQDQLVRRHLDILDRYAMAASLELRVPFLDDGMLRLSSRLPTRFKVRHELGVGKYILKHGALAWFGSSILDVVIREKAGLPQSGSYLSGQFSELCAQGVSDDYVACHPLKELFIFEDRGTLRYSKRDLVLFELFQFLFLEHRGAAPAHFKVRDFINDRSRRLTDQSAIAVASSATSAFADA